MSTMINVTTSYRVYTKASACTTIPAIGLRKQVTYMYKYAACMYSYSNNIIQLLCYALK